ncbi:MAG: hypothetical protein A2Z99_09945 [Treponema sp. GWB1_62_6]|nr:MAG: hypothetical protein A2Z99_09945 [Treponema sp. GWB1_62_6]OHE66463.1 MAG: hypothetical protein A2001_17620 [Treponema sp. GWC1_61_84]OHE68492.1 MAG: hypothetical protein A2413_06765 [Treponema sp. RIFOXYC1_FULL_61_9]HCM29108.1 hypothetical protein [Treponema sp.]
MYTLAKIAFRNLNRQKKRSFLLGGAIAFGIFIVTLINGFAGAFQANVAGNMAQLFAGHVFVEGSEKTAKGKAIDIIRDDAPVMAAFAAAGISTEYVAKRSYANATLVFEGKKATQNIYGADLEGERFLKDRLLFKEGSWENLRDERALVLSEGVAKKLKVEVGDRLLVQLKTVTGQNNVGEFVLAGISQDMGLFSSMLAYAHRAYVNELLDIGPDEYQMLGALVDDLTKAELRAKALQPALAARAPVFELPPAATRAEKAAAAKLAKEAKAARKKADESKAAGAATAEADDDAADDAEEAAAAAKSANGSPMQSRYQKLYKLAKKETWEGTKYRVFTINDLLSQIEDLVKVLNIASVYILAVLFVIIMVGITNTFRMIMYERIKEIGTMRAVGMQRPAVRNLFLLEAGFLAVAGTLAGWALSAIAMAIISIFDFGTSTVFALLLKNGHLSFAVQAPHAIGGFLLVLVLTLLAAALPARKASRLEPAAALRTSM